MRQLVALGVAIGPHSEHERRADSGNRRHRRAKRQPRVARAGSTPSHIGMPITATAITFTALVIRKSSTDRVAMRFREMPLLRITQAPRHDPAEAADRDDRIDREL